ncbi:MAG: primosomal protein DnaI [Candidatus Izemoplasmataceae bacterium]
MKPLKFDKNPRLVDEITEQLSEDPMLKEFFIEHDIDSKTIERHLSDLIVYKDERPRCDDCPGLHACTQDTLGMQPVLSYKNGRITLAYKPCAYLKAREANMKENARITSLYMPKMIYEASLEDFHMKSANRKELYQRIIALTNQYARGDSIKGLYIHGRYQIGKTYALAAIGNRFSELGFNVTIAYYPDLVREMKSAIGDGSLESQINKLKATDVLLLDDIGGESFSRWVRDEVLGPILQYRLLDSRPTFFTSNLPLEELVKYMIESNQEAEMIKGYRILERIKRLSDPFNMKSS